MTAGSKAQQQRTVAELADQFERILQGQLGSPEFRLADDFFAAGGDSLVALAVVADARASGIAVDLRDLLTSAIMAEVPLTEVEATANPENGPLLDVADLRALPPGVITAYRASELQLGLIYLCELSDDPALYHDLIGFTILRPLDRDAFFEAVAWLVERHEALRTAFDLSTFSVPLALVFERVAGIPEFVDARHSSVEHELERWRRDELSRAFDWEQAPLLRCVAIEDGNRVAVGLAVHHAVIDGWSLSRVVVDLVTAYARLLDGGRPQAAPLPAGVQQEFVRLERADATDPAARAFWTEQVSGTRPLLARATGVPRPSGQLATPFDSPTVHALRACSVAAGAPLKSLCLALHWVALVRWVGREHDVLTGMIANGRPETVGGDEIVGLFLNTVPVRLLDMGVLDGMEDPRTWEVWSRLARAAVHAEDAVSRYRRFPYAEIDRLGSGAPVELTFNFTRFRLYRALRELPGLSVEGWWSWDRASFPMMANFVFDAPDFGDAHLLAYDPSQVGVDRAEEYVHTLREALGQLIAAGEGVGPPDRRP